MCEENSTGMTGSDWCPVALEHKPGKALLLVFTCKLYPGGWMRITGIAAIMVVGCSCRLIACHTGVLAKLRDRENRRNLLAQKPLGKELKGFPYISD